MNTMSCMAKRVLLVTAVLLSVAACTTSQRGEKETTGAILGAALGGLLGAQIGDGSGRLAATALGVAVGGFIGAEAGKSLDRADRVYHDAAARNALWQSPTGTASTWNNPRSGNAGAITPAGDAFTDQRGRACRRFADSVTWADGTQDQTTGVACRNSDGSWEIAG